ncbi:thioredoxin family protein [Pseudonocardia endophytica]|uniref:Thioredoxin n=1 Tax=Pseudonocardia endophytica TaxID=401976 RepID=A0A4R1I3G2_PSEEN|nr:thioredoxin family protein [Pseudonocardia endophytica]TCK27059.1 thioredoxin [Pseudonocardia endophytica]
MSVAGVATVLVVVLVVGVVGVLLRRRSGRVRTPSDRGVDGWSLAGVQPGTDDRFLLLQLSSPVCAPCRTTAGVLAGMAAGDPGMRHVEVDVAERVDVARALGVMSTPTTVAFGRDGAELLRVSGVPSADELRSALAG